MGELGFNKFFGAALATFLLIFGLNEVSTYVFGGGGHHEAHEYECPDDWAKEKFHGYRIDIPCGASASADEGPIFDLGALLAGADIAAGETVLDRQCATCHTWNEGGANGTGPNLYGIIGRSVASGAGFNYSSALSGVGGEWSYEQMNAWLTNPGSFARGTSMAYAGLRSPRRDNDRVNVIAYLASLNPASPAFPDPLPIEANAEEAIGEDAAATVEGALEDGAATPAEGESVVELPSQTIEVLPGAAEAINAAIPETVTDAATDAAGDLVETAQDAAESAVDTATGAAETAGNSLLQQATEAAEEAVEEATDGEH